MLIKFWIETKPSGVDTNYFNILIMNVMLLLFDTIVLDRREQPWLEMQDSEHGRRRCISYYKAANPGTEGKVAQSRIFVRLQIKCTSNVCITHRPLEEGMKGKEHRHPRGLCRYCNTPLVIHKG